ncbi:hypothetical protein T07_2089 [Trichinella nelsoni]|uniref:Uncharacterized protein n=1 Tax=Trichinella nelsoni TaxID=6336 RepID=A0A0V0RID7_9BILA|nr:hypothetical protein T07_2089 [Trichinella nelsoni]
MSWKAFRPLFAHCTPVFSKKWKLAECRWLSGDGCGFFIVNLRDGLCFFSTTLFQNSYFYHLVCCALIHRTSSLSAASVAKINISLVGE